MPEVKRPPGVDPNRSGTGQGALTKRQREILADLWFYLQDERSAREYFAQVENMRRMDGKDAGWVQRNLDKSYYRDPEGAWERIQQQYSLGGPDGRVPSNDYEFSQPQDVWVGERGTSPFKGWIPPSMTPYHSDAWTPPEGFDKKPPPGWSDRESPYSEGLPAGQKAKQASPDVAAVAAALFAQKKPGTPPTNRRVTGVQEF